MKATDLKDNRAPHILIYGPAGCGKTALASQASGGYMLDFDDGMLTAKNLIDQFTPLRHAIEFDTFSDTNPSRPKAWLAAKRKIFEIRAACDKGVWKDDALILDSLTKMGMICYNQIVSQLGRSVGKVQLQDWGMMVGEMRNILQIVLRIPHLVIMTAHETFIEVGTETYIKPKALGKKLPEELPPLFDEVWRMKAKRKAQHKVDYTVDWFPSENVDVRTRSGVLKEFSINEIGLAGVLREINYSYQEKKGA